VASYIDDPNPLDRAMVGPTVWPLHQFDETRIALGLHAVIDNQERFAAIVNPTADQLPQLSGPKAFLPEKVVDDNVAT